ncbi:hypothetical protein FNF31_04917 [Cafeteria roenbergensis]|nr:hypothetical protein FNF31_04917 [Cafeteria roenbergensis]
MRAAAVAAGRRGLATAAPKPNVGILAMDAYFPGRYVSQDDLEQADGVSSGKYTIGLGQKEMAFVSDREDINSVMLSAVSRLLERYEIDPALVGRLEVGTESLVDKSKSSRTTLMSLFGDNRDMEGATVMNACYGGTAALLNSAAWAESSEWRAEKPYAIYVAGDVAVYEAGPARPTGGCGAVAVLVGRDAPIRLVPGVRTSYAEDAYDFYKPSMSSEYPVVNGKDSQVCYMRALDSCYRGFKARSEAAEGQTAPSMLTDSVGSMLFHSPYNKLVQQSLRRLLFNDAVRAIEAGQPLPEALEPVREWAEACAGQDSAAALEASYTDRALDKALQAVDRSLSAHASLVAPGETVSQRVGNTYTGAMHANLLGLVCNRGANLRGSKAAAFSYGSGLIATMFGLDFAADATGPFTLERIQETADVFGALDARTRVPCEQFTSDMLLREAAYGRNSFTPVSPIEQVPPGAFYLESVDETWRRSYARRA